MYFYRCPGGQDGTLTMLAIADPNKEDTANMLASLPSRTGEQPDNIQVEHGNLQVGQGSSRTTSR
jgi:hypothetical protein